MLFQTTGILLRDLQIGIFRCFPVDPTSQLLAYQPSPSKASQPNRCKPYYLTYHVQYRSRSSIKMMCINELRPNTRSDSQTDRQTDRQAGRQTDRQTERRTERQTEKGKEEKDRDGIPAAMDPTTSRQGREASSVDATPSHTFHFPHTKTCASINLTSFRISYPFGYHTLSDMQRSIMRWMRSPTLTRI